MWGCYLPSFFFCLGLISDFLHFTHTFLQVVTFDFVALCPFRAGAMPSKANRKIFLNFIFILDFSRQSLYKYKQRATVTRHSYKAAPMRPSSPPKKTSWRKANIHSKRGCPKLSCGDIKLRLPLGWMPDVLLGLSCGTQARSSTIHKAISDNFYTPR